MFRYIVVVLTFLIANIRLCETTAGMRITVTQRILQKINKEELEILRGNLARTILSDKTEKAQNIELRLSNTRVLHVGEFEPEIDLRSDGKIMWSLYINSMTMKTNYWVREDLGWIALEYGGSCTAALSRTYTLLTVTLTENSRGISTASSNCYTSVGHLDLRFSESGIMDIVLNLLADIIKQEIQTFVAAEICSIVEKETAKFWEDIKDIEVTYSITIFGIPFTLDNSFTSIIVSSDTISTFHKGAIQWEGQTYQSSEDTFFPSVATSFDVAFDIKDEIVNNILKAVVNTGKLNGSLSYSTISQNNMKEFYLTCDTGTFCFGKILKKTTEQFPDRVMGLKWWIKRVNLDISRDQIIGEMMGRVNFSADSASESVPLFSAEIDLAIPFQLRFTRGILSARAVAVGGQVTIDQSNIGKVLSQQVTEAVKLFFLPNIEQELLKIFNAQATQYAIRLPRHMQFQTSNLRLYDGVVRIEAHLCYREDSCLYTRNSRWVGRENISYFLIDDVVSTTTTATTTTTTTTSSTITTTSKSPSAFQPKAKQTDRIKNANSQSRTSVSFINVLSCIVSCMTLILKCF